MVTFTHEGDLNKTNTFLERALEVVKLGQIDKYGKWGVDALANNTPVDTGKTAESWDYGKERRKSGIELYWYNTNENDGVNIATILQYGHGTKNGGYVKGIDYVNPAMQPVFNDIVDETWKELTIV